MSRTLRGWSALLLLAASLSPAAAADAPLGRWLATEADQKSTSIIELYLEGDQLAGRVVEVVDRNGQAVADTCADCPGELQGQAIVGMRFLWGLHEENGRWTGGKVMDLRDGLTQGVIANADLEVPGDTLTLHAYPGLRAFGQSRTWHCANTASRQTPPQAAETS